MARAKAKKKSAARKTAGKKPSPKKAPGKKSPAKKAPGKPAPAKKLAAAGGEDVIYSDVRREMRSRLLGRLLGV